MIQPAHGARHRVSTPPTSSPATTHTSSGAAAPGSPGTSSSSTTTTAPLALPPPQSAQAEDFAGQPSDVLLTYAQAVEPGAASECVGLNASGAEGFGGVDQGPAAQTIRLELAPGAAMPARVQCPAGASGVDTLTVAPALPSLGGVASDPIDPRYLSELPFGDRSFWVQPWRAYLDTWPASRLVGSLGIDFNVRAAEAEDAALLLHDSGFKLARVEIGWNSLSYEEPGKFADLEAVEARLLALHKHGLRPLILLNANSREPTPTKEVTLETTEEAPAGATSVKLTAASAQGIVPGKTGFDRLSFGGSPDLLIKSVNSSDVATLSRPLPAVLAAGPHEGATLLYAPFGPPTLAGGQPNPAFQTTLRGWLNYVATVCKEAESIFGPEGYDLEVWNEQSFGSQFLEEENYYSPARETGSGSVTEALLDATVAYLRNPANGISPGVGITDGFANQTPLASGALVPAGTTALSKHPYNLARNFPTEDTVNTIKPINALGQSDYTTISGLFQPLFIPTFQTLMPEYYLTGLQTESLVRDLAPQTTDIYGVPHGRQVAPAGGTPPQMWVTEYNISTSALFPKTPANPTSNSGPQVNQAQAARLQAKIELRSLVSMVGKGVAREYFYAATSEGFGLISPSFMAAVDSNPSAYPGDQLGGETMASLQRLLGRFQGPGPQGPPRQLKLLSIAQEGSHTQFAGNGTAAHPPLYDRDVLTVFPFQSSPTRFEIPIYVMTENLTTVYNTGDPEGSAARFEMPNETFRITLGNLPETATPPAVSAYDPIDNESTPARFVSRRGNQAVFEVAATNYPRVLTVDYTGA